MRFLQGQAKDSGRQILELSVRFNASCTWLTARFVTTRCFLCCLWRSASPTTVTREAMVNTWHIAWTLQSGAEQ
jgi:hypothetical protein